MAFNYHAIEWQVTPRSRGAESSPPILTSHMEGSTPFPEGEGHSSGVALTAIPAALRTFDCPNGTFGVVGRALDSRLPGHLTDVSMNSAQ